MDEQQPTWEECKAMDYLAIAGPVVDETFEPYMIFMYSLLAGALGIGRHEESMTDKSDAPQEDGND